MSPIWSSGTVSRETAHFGATVYFSSEEVNIIVEKCGPQITYFNNEDGASMFIRNNGIILQDYI